MTENKMERGVGVLLHITSLAGGDFSGAYSFIDFLAEAKIKYWQVLAMGPTGYGDSPYAPLSVFALNPNFVYSKNLKTYPQPEIETFIKQNNWVEFYAYYMTIKEACDHKDWINWPVELQTFDNPSVAAFLTTRKDRIIHHICVQMNLFEQWAEIHKYANDRGVKIIGDIPIYAAMDSTDVWAKREQFSFTGGKPSGVAGVGPDYFNSDGQLWGNPLYNFEHMQKDKYKWWIMRLKHQLALCDVLRIDHFRAFDTYYKIPYGAPTAKNGEWLKGPGIKFFNAVKKAIPDAQLILEDLGEITQSVRNLRDKTGYPGMRVMQFGFGGDMSNEHLPSNYPQNCVGYLGTHDNDTFVGFLKSINPKERKVVDKYLSSNNVCVKDVTRIAIEDILSCPADIVVIPMQDILLQDTKHRMNVPGTTYGNWKYRLNANDLKPELSNYIRLLIERSGR
ncbi:MAG: 4-alpha-glucanotransferase [Firmicutes bacterium]|nr:4-alpha-glucanotransferase [Bacillota bacterium]